MFKQSKTIKSSPRSKDLNIIYQYSKTNAPISTIQTLFSSLHYHTKRGKCLPFLEPNSLCQSFFSITGTILII